MLIFPNFAVSVAQLSSSPMVRCQTEALVGISRPPIGFIESMMVSYSTWLAASFGYGLVGSVM